MKKGQNYSPLEAFDHYQKYLEDENKKQQENTEKILKQVKGLVSPKYMQSIKEFLNDNENGIWGDLKIVDNTIGDWQDEYQDEDDETNYWNDLKGMFVNQSCGYSGDDFSGTLEIKLIDNLFLRCSFSL